jgi:hypothetical protein
MIAAREPSSRRRIALLLAASGCVFTSLGACQPNTNSALGQGTFVYVCSKTDPTQPSDDAWCDSETADAIPDVAVGAPFQIQYGGGAPQPAVAALAQSTGEGWSLVQTGWLGFIVWSGSDVLDYTHIRGRSVASLRLQPDVITIDVGGALGAVAAVPLADDGTTLGGAISCTFASSDVDSIAVSSQGRTARLTALAPGRDVVLTASCMGQQAQCQVHTSTAGASADASGEAGD